MSECSYSDFLDKCSLLFKLGVSCIFHVYHGLRPFAHFEIYFTYQKKKKKILGRRYINFAKLIKSLLVVKFCGI
jgi:hypothetical protein